MTDADEKYEWMVEYIFVSEYPKPEGIRELGRLHFGVESNARDTYAWLLTRPETYQDVHLLRKPKPMGWETVLP